MNFKPFEQQSLRIYNTMPGAQNVDIYLNEKPFVKGLNYQQMSQCLPVQPGMYDMKVCPSYQDQALLHQKIKVDSSKLVTLAPGDKMGMGQLFISDDMDKMPKPMMPMVPQQPMFDMYPDYGKMPMHGQVMPQMPGCMCGQPQQPMYDMPQMPMQPKYDLPQMPPMQQMPGCMYQGMPQYGQNLPMMDWNEPRDSMMPKTAMVRFLHLSPNTPAVDITLPDGTVLFSNIGYRGVTEFIDVNPGVYTLQARPAGTNQVALNIPNVVLEPGEVVSIHAIGLLNGTPALEAFVLTEEEHEHMMM